MVSDERVKLKGVVNIQVHSKGVLIDEFTAENIVLYQGKASIITGLVNPTAVIIGRMAIGDRGTVPSDPTVPRTVAPSATRLFHEVYRQNIQTAIITTIDADNSATFTTIFRAVDIPITSYLDQTKPVINEVALVLVDTLMPPAVRPPVAAPDPQFPGEQLFAIRTFRTIPFEAASDTTISLKYSIMIL